MRLIIMRAITVYASAFIGGGVVTEICKINIYSNNYSTNRYANFWMSKEQGVIPRRLAAVSRAGIFQLFGQMGEMFCVSASRFWLCDSSFRLWISSWLALSSG